MQTYKVFNAKILEPMFVLKCAFPVDSNRIFRTTKRTSDILVCIILVMPGIMGGLWLRLG